jgi:hypothetical protein
MSYGNPAILARTEIEQEEKNFSLKYEPRLGPVAFRPLITQSLVFSRLIKQELCHKSSEFQQKSIKLNLLRYLKYLY